MGAGYSIKAKGTEADIFIYEDVGEGWMGGVSAKQFADDLRTLGAVSTLNVHISSLGGDVVDGLAIYRMLVDHKARVVSYIDGWAASIASVIAMAGNEIRIAEAGAVMIHDAYGIAIGTSTDFRALADQLDANTGAIAGIYEARTRNPLDKIRGWMSEETWFYGKQALDAGFADSVMDNLRIAARYNPQLHRFRNAPTQIAERPMRDAANARIAAFRVKIEARQKGLRAA
jgi:ATP-dependent Clp protease protease subunit